MAAYCFIVWQVVVLAIWLIGRGRLARLAGFFLGSFAAAVVFTALLGVFLLIPAFLGMIYYGIGLMGFTPLFTCRVFGQRARETLQVRDPLVPVWMFWLFVLVGFLFSLLVPLQIATLLRIAGLSPVAVAIF